MALGGNIYLWNAGSGDISPLLEMENTDDYVSSVSWIKEGNILAVGTSTAEVQVECLVIYINFCLQESPRVLVKLSLAFLVCSSPMSPKICQ